MTQENEKKGQDMDYINEGKEEKRTLMLRKLVLIDFSTLNVWYSVSLSSQQVAVD